MRRGCTPTPATRRWAPRRGGAPTGAWRRADRDCWGQGLIPEAVKEIIRHAFADLGYQALWAAYYDGNRKSKRVMQKCGMTYRLSRIEAVEQLGETRLAHYFAVTRREWER